MGQAIVMNAQKKVALNLDITKGRKLGNRSIGLRAQSNLLLNLASLQLLYACGVDDLASHQLAEADLEN